MLSFEEIKYAFSKKTKCINIQKEIRHTVRTVMFCGVLIMCMCITPNVVDAILLQDTNISGKLHYTEATEELINHIDTWDGSGYKLSETVFGQQYALNAVSAMDNRAYTNAVADALIADAEYQALLEEQRLAEAFYVPNVNLEYPEEGLYFSYALQKYTYELCLEKELDYWTVMGVIARESRFDNSVRGYSDGVTYYGLMQMNWEVVEVVREWTGDYTLDPTDPYDNIFIGTTYLRYMIDKTGYEQGGVFAYGIGLGGYRDAVNQGIYTDRITIKAYTYRDMLYAKERYTATEARELGLIDE